MLYLVAPLAYAFELMNQVKKGEEHQERQQYQAGCRVDLPRQMAFIDLQRHFNRPQAKGFCRR